MRVQRFLSLLLAVAFSISVGSLHADSSVQWGDETNDVAVSRHLAWKKPKVSSGVVTADRAPDVQRAIRQVQYVVPTLPSPGTPNGVAADPFTPSAPLPQLQTPPEVESPPATGPTPAPNPVDPISVLPPPRQRGTREIECPETTGFKSIREISYDIRPMPGELPKECPLIAPPYAGRSHEQTCYFWTASALSTKGAYFENVQLERYGHTICPALEPIFSGVRFFVTIPLLPYKMGLTPPNECVYTLGHYRVGNCAPYMLDPLPISVRAVLFQTAAVGGAVAIIP